jgi:hypothetical protein
MKIVHGSRAWSWLLYVVTSSNCAQTHTRLFMGTTDLLSDNCNTNVSSGGVVAEVDPLLAQQGVSAAVWADVNGDGDSDLVSVTQSTGRLVVLLSRGPSAPMMNVAGDGSSLQLPLWFGPVASLVCTADFNGDGRTDVFAVGRNATTPHTPAMLLYGDGSATPFTTAEASAVMIMVRLCNVDFSFPL